MVSSRRKRISWNKIIFAQRRNFLRVALMAIAKLNNNIFLTENHCFQWFSQYQLIMRKIQIFFRTLLLLALLWTGTTT